MKKQGKKSESGSSTAVQTGGFKGAWRTRRRLKIILIVSLVAITLLGVWGYSIMRSLNPSVIEGIPYDDETLSGDYLTMNEGEIVYVLKKRTGLDANQLRQQSITEETVKNFYNGYEVARAMRGLKDGSKSLEAYKAADAHVSKEDVQTLQAFYLDYTRVCLEEGKVDEVKAIATKGMKMIDESSLSAGEKTDEKAEFEDLIWLAEQ